MKKKNNFKKSVPDNWYTLWLDLNQTAPNWHIKSSLTKQLLKIYCYFLLGYFFFLLGIPLRIKDKGLIILGKLNGFIASNIYWAAATGKTGGAGGMNTSPAPKGTHQRAFLRALRHKMLESREESFLNDEESRKASCRESNLSLFLENKWYFSYSDWRAFFKRWKYKQAQRCQDQDTSEQGVQFGWSIQRLWRRRQIRLAQGWRGLDSQATKRACRGWVISSWAGNVI